MRCKLQPKLCWAGCTQTCMLKLIHNKCSLLSICGQKPQQWMPQLCHMLPHSLVFICWVPQITLTLPQVYKMRPFPPKQEAENIHAVSHVLLSQFFSSSIGELSSFNQSDARFVKLDKQFPEHVERIVLDPKHSFVAVC